MMCHHTIFSLLFIAHWLHPLFMFDSKPQSFLHASPWTLRSLIFSYDTLIAFNPSSQPLLKIFVPSKSMCLLAARKPSPSLSNLHPCLSFSLGSQSSLGALAIAVITSPQEIKLTEVHVRRDPARLVGLSRLAASLAEQASISRAGAWALRLGVGGLEGGSGALTAGKRGGKEQGGGGRWLVEEGGGRERDRCEGGDRRGRSGRDRGEEGVHVGGGETKERGGERERTGRRRGGWKREEGGGQGERGKGRKGVKREFNYGLQDIDGSLAGTGVKRAKGVKKERQGQSVGRIGWILASWGQWRREI